MRCYYNEWMNEAIKEYTPSGRIKKPSYSLVANWVKDSWDAIDPNMIKRLLNVVMYQMILTG